MVNIEAHGPIYEISHKKSYVSKDKKLEKIKLVFVESPHHTEILVKTKGFETPMEIKSYIYSIFSIAYSMRTLKARGRFRCRQSVNQIQKK